VDAPVVPWVFTNVQRRRPRGETAKLRAIQPVFFAEKVLFDKFSPRAFFLAGRRIENEPRRYPFAREAFVTPPQPEPCP
jgi:hypothetical protein